jgi:hypothetical protein
LLSAASAIIPFAAGCGSTTTGWPIVVVRPVAIMRAIMSDAPPAALVTMILIGRFG